MSGDQISWRLALLLPLFLFTRCHSTSSLEATAAHPKPNSSQIVRRRLTENAILPCNTTKSSADLELIEWWYKFRDVDKGRIIGIFEASTSRAKENWTRAGAYHITSNGSLLVLNVRRELVERYECVSKFTGGRELVNAVYLRLDFSNWYALEPFSLFFGSMIAAAVFCAASFLLNLVWIFVRWVVLRWIKRTERLSRVRSLLVAMEKYRQKHIESLHEGYSRRVSQIRDNYHNQLDILRQSYTESADRFRDYRQAQLDSVQQHLDSYYQQIGRLREFGSRRLEQVWESYDRSVSAVRTFTLEQRLKILRQYKVKQRYVNKLLEAMALETNTEVLSKKEAAIRELLAEDEPLPIWPGPADARDCALEGTAPEGSIPRSASYYSLPEFVVREEEGEQGHGQQEMDQQQPSISNSSNTTRLTRVQFTEER